MGEGLGAMRRRTGEGRRRGGWDGGGLLEEGVESVVLFMVGRVGSRDGDGNGDGDGDGS